MNDGKPPSDTRERAHTAPQQRDAHVRARRFLPTRAASIVDNVLAARKLTSRVFQARVFQAFADVAGETIRKHARPMRLRGTELTIAVDSASWRQQLTFLIEDLKKKMNDKLGREVVSLIRLVHGDATAEYFVDEVEVPYEPLRDAKPEELAQADTISRMVGDHELATIIAHAYLGAKRSGRT